MVTVRTVAQLRDAVATRRAALPEGARVGLVPTMGALHDGHVSLLRRARRDCDVVVMSLFVNPAQFNDAADLEVYPRDEQRDADLAQQAGVDVLFAPGQTEIYPAGFSTTVSVGGGPSQGLEGAHRGAGHFQGVATVVCKLLNMTGPDVAYFGAKDAQQLAVIRQLVTDLNLPVEIESVPTVREADGLALSSRNVLLGERDRRRAPALHRALNAVAAAVAAGERDPRVATAVGRGLIDGAGARLEYLELVDPATMSPVTRIDGDVLAVVAASLGSVRLIDNLLIETAPAVTLPLPEPAGGGRERTSNLPAPNRT